MLVAGYFSFDGNVTTAGDLLAADVAVGWLGRAGIDHEVARAPKYGDGVDWEQADPAAYSHLLWVCGPVGKGPRQTALRERFAAARQVAVDVSLLDELADWQPYAAVVERDLSRLARPDISLLAESALPPVVGLCLIAGQREYGERDRHEQVARAFEELVASRPMATIKIDTVIKPGRAGRRGPAEVEALLARVDAVLTNRLHGLALAIKHEVPVVAVDGVRGGAKLTRQARALGWPALIAVEDLTAEALAQALDFCLSAQGRQAAAHARERGVAGAADVERELFGALEL